jgi:hypothetical protein
MKINIRGSTNYSPSNIVKCTYHISGFQLLKYSIEYYLRTNIRHMCLCGRSER